MCARYEHTVTDLARLCQELEAIAAVRENPGPRWNIAPTTTSPIVRAGDGGRELTLARWGLVPLWAKDTKIAASTINARSETVFAKPAFRAAAKVRRWLVPATGWYEWIGPPKARTPVRIRRGDRVSSPSPDSRSRGLGRRGRCRPSRSSRRPRVRSSRRSTTGCRWSWASRTARWLDPVARTSEALATLLRSYAGNGLVAVAADPRLNRAGVDGEEFAGETVLELPVV
jgi:putative SOS response-associated peptidase YedK